MNRYETIKRHTNRTMDRSGAPPAAWFLCLVHIYFCLNHCIDQNLGDGTKSPLMMANFVQNNISPLILFFFLQPVYYLLDANEQSKSLEMRSRWIGVDENIGTKMCWKLVDDNSGEKVYRSTICSAIEPGTANLQVDPLEPLTMSVEPLEPIGDHDHALLDDFMSLADFKTPLSHTTRPGPVNSIQASTKSKAWKDVERGVEPHENT